LTVQVQSEPTRNDGDAEAPSPQMSRAVFASLRAQVFTSERLDSKTTGRDPCDVRPGHREGVTAEVDRAVKDQRRTTLRVHATNRGDRIDLALGAGSMVALHHSCITDAPGTSKMY
jgi:hypothetical protein